MKSIINLNKLLRRLRVKTVFAVLIICLSTNLVLAQDGQWKLTFNNGSTIQNPVIDSVYGSLLYIRTNGRVKALQLESVEEIRLVRKSIIPRSAWIGALLGAVLGIVIAPDLKRNHRAGGWRNWGRGFEFGFRTFIVKLCGGLVGGFTGFFIGGMIGGGFISDDVYDMSGIGVNEKIKIIGSIPLN